LAEFFDQSRRLGDSAKEIVQMCSCATAVTASVSLQASPGESWPEERITIDEDDSR